ncbi:MAG: type II secretion system protein N [Pseudomonadota bacterium]
MPSAADTALEKLISVERLLRWVVEGVLVIALALLVARIGWLIVSPSNSVATYTQRPLPAPMRGASSTLAIATDRTLLVQNNPFQQGEADVIVQDVPETNLNLNLDGLRMSTEGGEAGNAIIRTPNGIGKNYSVGDEILAGVTLERILSDRVIINRDGANETLMLGGRGAGLSVITDDSRISTEIDVSSQATIPESPAQPDVTEAQIDAPELLLGSINAGPVRVNGAITGYRLDPLGSPEIMQQAGLAPGDVLLQINGASVAQLDTIDVIDRISSAETVDLTVNRNGSEQTIRLRFGE